MYKTALPKMFHLRRSGELLAVREACQPSGKMFWLTCDLSPTALFCELSH